MNENIAEQLRPLVVSIDRVQPMVGNPRRGDAEAVARSYQRFGQRKPIVARITGGTKRAPTGVVLAGNHQLAAALMLGWEQMAVVWVEEDEQTALAYSLADNRTSDLATWDEGDLAALIADLDAELLAAASFDTSDIERLLQAPTGEGTPLLEGVSYSVLVRCESEADQRALLDRLRSEGLDASPLMM